MKNANSLTDHDDPNKQLQDHEVAAPKSRKGRPKLKEGVVYETGSEGKFVVAGGKRIRYTGEKDRHDKLTDEEFKQFKDRAQKLKDRATARAEKKQAKPETKETKPEPDKTKPEKRGRGRTPTELGKVTERTGYKGVKEKWVKVEEGKTSVRYKGDVTVGENISAEEIESLKAKPKGKRGRSKLAVGTITQRTHNTVINLGDVLGDGKKQVYNLQRTVETSGERSASHCSGC